MDADEFKHLFICQACGAELPDDDMSDEILGVCENCTIHGYDDEENDWDEEYEEDV